MHYKNGTPAKKGDIVLAPGNDGIPVVGLVVQTVGNAQTCNLVVAPIDTARFWVTAKDTVLVEEYLTPAPANNP